MNLNSEDLDFLARLRALCIFHDREVGKWPDHPFEGSSVYHDILATMLDYEMDEYEQLKYEDEEIDPKYKEDDY